MEVPTRPAMCPYIKTTSKIYSISQKGFSYVKFSVLSMTNGQEIMMPFLFNQNYKCYKSICFVFVPRPLAHTMLTNEVHAQSMHFLFSMIELADLNMFCML